MLASERCFDLFLSISFIPMSSVLRVALSTSSPKIGQISLHFSISWRSSCRNISLSTKASAHSDQWLLIALFDLLRLLSFVMGNDGSIPSGHGG